MIQKLYTVVVKDKDGYFYVYEENGVSFMFSDLGQAEGEYNQILSRLNQELESKVKKKTGFFSKEYYATVTEERKKEIKWFIENSKIAGAVVKL